MVGGYLFVTNSARQLNQRTVFSDYKPRLWYLRGLGNTATVLNPINGSIGRLVPSFWSAPRAELLSLIIQLNVAVAVSRYHCYGR